MFYDKPLTSPLLSTSHSVYPSITPRIQPALEVLFSHNPSPSVDIIHLWAAALSRNIGSGLGHGRAVTAQDLSIWIAYRWAMALNCGAYPARFPRPAFGSGSQQAVLPPLLIPNIPATRAWTHTQNDRNAPASLANKSNVSSPSRMALKAERASSPQRVSAPYQGTGSAHTRRYTEQLHAHQPSPYKNPVPRPPRAHRVQYRSEREQPTVNLNNSGPSTDIFPAVSSSTQPPGLKLFTREVMHYGSNSHIQAGETGSRPRIAGHSLQSIFPLSPVSPVSSMSPEPSSREASPSPSDSRPICSRFPLSLPSPPSSPS